LREQGVYTLDTEHLKGGTVIRPSLALDESCAAQVREFSGDFACHSITDEVLAHYERGGTTYQLWCLAL
jgi:hypothetical protein